MVLGKSGSLVSIWGPTNVLIDPGELESSSSSESPKRVQDRTLQVNRTQQGKGKENIGEWAGWPTDKRSRRTLLATVNLITEEEKRITEEEKAIPIDGMIKLAPKVARRNRSRNGVSGSERVDPNGVSGSRRGLILETLERKGPLWTTSGKTLWRGNKKLLSGIPAVRRLPPHWDISDEGKPARVRAAMSVANRSRL